MQMQASKFSARHYTSLDGLRGLAFLLVFIHHYALTSHSTQRWILALAWLADGGWMGVDLFFVLSGFLITGILLDTRGDPHYYRNFYVRRALRIFPLYYGLFLVAYLLTPWLGLHWRPGHLAYVLYAGNVAYNLDPSLAHIPPLLELLHFWSLAVEEQFYLVWPFVIALIAGRRKLLRVCIGVSIGSLLLRIGMLLLMQRGMAYEWAYAQLPTHADGLLFGAIAAISVRSAPLQQITKIAGRILPILFCLLIGMCLAVGSLGFHTLSMTTVGYPILAGTCASFLLRSLMPGTLPHWLGTLPILRFFGRYSYGMYIYHLVFSLQTSRLLPFFQRQFNSIAIGGFVYAFVVLAGTTVAAVLSYELYERHWLKLKSKFSSNEAKTELAAS